MPYATTDDDVRLYYEEAGSGVPIIFVHEFGGDHRSWEPQIRHFSRAYRCLVFAARGFPPSDVPLREDSYSQDHAVADVTAVLDAAGVDRAFVVGSSMGGFAAVHLALRQPERVYGCAVAACGYGAHPDAAEGWREESERIAAAYEQEGSAATAAWYGVGPARVQYEAKDPRGHAEHMRILREHDPRGAALTMRGVQRQRPSLYAMREELAACTSPVLVIAGDEDDGVLETDLMLKRTIPRCGLAVLPKTGHLPNLEEPVLFNDLLERFFVAVEHDAWRPRDPRSLGGSNTGGR